MTRDRKPPRKPGAPQNIAVGGLTGTYRFGVGVNVVLICVLGIAVAVGILTAVHQMSHRTDLRFDMTADRIYELDPLAKTLLRDLQAPLKITFVWGYDTDILERVKDNQGRPRGDYLREYYAPILQRAQVEIRRVLGEWERTSGNVALTIIHQEVDPVRTEEFARNMNLSTQEVLNRVIFQLGGRRQVVTLRSMMEDMQWGFFASQPGLQTILPRMPGSWRVQEELTATLRSISHGIAVPIGVVRGLGGRVEPGTPEYAVLANMLQGEGYEMVPFELEPGKPVPPEVKAVLVPAPRTPLDPARSRILEEYDRSGGRLLILASPRLPERFERLLEPYGCALADAVVLDQKNTNPLRASNEIESTKLGTGSHPVISPLKGRVTLYLGIARPLELSSDRQAGAQGRYLLKGSDFAQTMPVTFDPATGAMSVVDRKTNRPKPGLGAALTRPTDSVESRIVVYGSAGLFRPDVMLQGALYGNRDLVLNTFAWLTDRPNAIGLTPRAAAKQRFIHPNRLRTPLTAVGLIGLPLLSALCGLVVYLTRRS